MSNRGAFESTFSEFLLQNARAVCLNQLSLLETICVSRLCNRTSHVNNDRIVKKVALLLSLLTCRMVRSKSYINTFLHVFSPGRTEAFFPVGALFGAAPAGEWARLAVLIIHG